MYNYFLLGFGASLLISIIAFCGAYVFKSVVIEDESIVLVFVGMLATIIVVGNYEQVKDIQREFESKVKEVAAIQTMPGIRELYKKMDDAIKSTEPLIRFNTENKKGKETQDDAETKIKLFSDYIDTNKIFISS